MFVQLHLVKPGGEDIALGATARGGATRRARLAQGSGDLQRVPGRLAAGSAGQLCPFDAQWRRQAMEARKLLIGLAAVSQQASIDPLDPGTRP